MLDQATLRFGLERLRARLEEDITSRAEEEPTISADLRQRYDAARAAKRTGLSFELWRAGEVTQAAVAWLLACVFVRFLEDNHLIQQPWISGPAPRLAAAKEQNLRTYRAGQWQTDRDYLLLCFEEIRKLPGVSALFDKEHNPLFRLTPTGHGARSIIDFFQKLDDGNNLVHDFSGTIDNTRFLGDLYQNISESARKRYALVQTPDFVVDFILDRTMEPALQEFGLQGFRIIDPACGSGHFLIAAFERLFYKWQKHSPALDPIDCASRALGSVYGVDLNPFAIAIARFRLLVSALSKCGVTRLSEAPNFQTNLAVGDSLLHGTRPRDAGRGVQRQAFNSYADFYYTTEDAPKLRIYLSQQYHAVVANPPYITVSDTALREQYRDRFGSASGKFQLSVPFTERCLDLAKYGDRPGYVGMIMSNAFMKRGFGRKLVEVYFPLWDITHIIDTSGVFIPGHATPTTIVFGRNRSPLSRNVRVVRGIRAEYSVPEEPSKAPVWSVLLDSIDHPGSESVYLSVSDTERVIFSKHPWSIGGGGASELKLRLDQTCGSSIAKEAEHVGVFGMTNADEVMIAGPQDFRRMSVPESEFRKLRGGDDIRDWSATDRYAVVFPYQDGLLNLSLVPGLLHWLWPSRTVLESRATFAGGTYRYEGRPWWAWHQVSLARLLCPRRLTFASIATHNHFVLQKGSEVSKQSAPIITVRDSASLEDHFALLGLLNSAVACFWMRQVCYPKGAGGIGGGLATEQWEFRFDFDPTNISRLPLPSMRPVALSAIMIQYSDDRAKVLPGSVVNSEVPTRACLNRSLNKSASLLSRMIALQEELDWDVYHLYNLTKESTTLPIDQVPEIELGQRAFEIIMARQMAEGQLETEWFNRHGSTPITQIPEHWPEPYRQLVQERIDTIASDRDIALIEQPEYKRRWNLPKWEALESEALRNWLLEHLEDRRYWPTDPPLLQTIANLASAAAENPDFLQVAELYTGRSDFQIETLVAELVEKQSIPFLPVLRYKGLGRTKRKQWEETWALQRREDAGETLSIDVPPKYDKVDFLTDTGWRLRGKLDVPKERWVSYPYLNRISDSTLLIGWAGYDHAQQALALAAYHQAVKEDGWAPARLIPVLAGILELLPWVKQWHNAPGVSGETPTGDFLAEFLRNELSTLNMTEDHLRNWTPPAAPRRPRTSRRNAIESRP